MHVVMAIGRRRTKAILRDVVLLLCTAERVNMSRREREIDIRLVDEEDSRRSGGFKNATRTIQVSVDVVAGLDAFHRFSSSLALNESQRG